MTTKQCGTCKLWDIEKSMNSPTFPHRKIAECKFPVPISVSKTCTYNDQGRDCPVYVERQDATEDDDDSPENARPLFKGVGK